MCFKFGLLCHLLNGLERNRENSRLTASKVVDLDTQRVRSWFNDHDRVIPEHGPEAVAFLSCLFPERRTDCVFELQERRLEPIIKRALGLGATRLKELQSWRGRDGTDFASTVERVMSASESDLRHDPGVTLEEIDETLDQIAAKSSFSSNELRAKVATKHAGPVQTDVALSKIFRRLHSSEAKWMVRMLLKTYSPVKIPETVAMQCFHFILPDLLAFQNSFEAAIKLLQRPTIRRMPPRVAKDVESQLRQTISEELVPQVGTMISRPQHEKARGIGHYCQLAGLKWMSVEQKYDGEYCQIHINLGKNQSCIKIFSNSGKDSTHDRIGLHGALRESLKLGTTRCPIKKQCILEGELLVWNDKNQQIEPFYKIRKHVQRSGRSLGTAQDSPVDPREHLMVMFYDLLLLDDIVCIKEPHEQRRQRLESLIHHVVGWADIGSREKIDFSSFRAPNLLRQTFARAIRRQWEGFVLKGCDEPFVSLNRTVQYIKLKKDYINGLGDTADLAIVGDAKDVAELRIGNLSWTTFYLGSLENKDDVRRVDEKPKFRIGETIGRRNISRKDILYLNQRGKFFQLPFAFSRPELDVILDQSQPLRPTELFKYPFVVEVMGAEFDKPANARHYALRFPRVQKIHDDRTYRDTVSFDVLQDMAREVAGPLQDDEDGQVELRWLKRLQSPRSVFDYSATLRPWEARHSVRTQI